MIDLALVPTAVLLAGAAVQLALARWLSRAAKGWLAVSAAAVAAVAVAAMASRTAGGSVLTATGGQWDAGIAVGFHVDGLSVLFMLMGTVIGGAILLYSVRYMEHETEGTTRFYILMLSFIAGFTLLVSTANLLLIYVAWEAMGLCSYFLVGFWYRQQPAVDGARKVLVITHVAGYGLFAAIVMLYVRTGTFDWTDPAMAPALSGGLIALLIVAAMAKSVLYPLHTWIPEAMNAPTPVSGLLHSACYVKSGVYLIARLYSIGEWHAAFGGALLLIGCLTMVVGAVFAVAQSDLKRLLAFSTVSQLGYIVAGLALGTDLGVAAGLYYAVSHGALQGHAVSCAPGRCSTPPARGTCGSWVASRPACRSPLRCGSWRRPPSSACRSPRASWRNGCCSTPRSRRGRSWSWRSRGCVSIVTVFYFLKATISVFYGAPGSELRTADIHEVAPTMRLGMGVLGALCLVFGLAPQLLMGAVVAPGGAVARVPLGRPDDLVRCARPGRGSLGVTVGGLAVIGAAALGGVAFGVVHASPARAVAVFTGGDPLPLNDAPGAVDFAEMAQAAFKPVYSLDPDPVYPADLGGGARHGRTCRRAGERDRRGSSDRDGGRVGRDPLPGGLAHLTQLILLAVLVAGIGLYAWSVPQGGRAWWWLAGTSAAFALAAVALSDSVRSAGTSWLQPDPPRRRGARRRRPRLVAWDGGGRPHRAAVSRRHRPRHRLHPDRRRSRRSGRCRCPRGSEKVALCLLVVGFALKLGLIPVYFWLPEVAAHAPAMTTALIVSVVDIATFSGTGGSARGRAAALRRLRGRVGRPGPAVDARRRAAGARPARPQEACSRSRPSPTSASCSWAWWRAGRSAGGRLPSAR